MDPDACLDEILDLIAQVETADEMGSINGLADELGDRVRALDGWLMKSGHLPARWKPKLTNGEQLVYEYVAGFASDNIPIGPEVTRILLRIIARLADVR